MNKVDVNLLSFRKYVLYTCALATWAFAPGLMFEPINVLKMSILVIGVSFCIPIALSLNSNGKLLKLPRLLKYSSLLYFTFYFFSLLFSEAPKNQSFWGVFGRNNGLLTNCCLFLILIFGFSLAKNGQAMYALRLFVISSVLPVVYGLVQFIGRDPIPWQQDGLFSTLGNVNFSSTYFALVAIASAGILTFDKNLRKNYFFVISSILNIILSLSTGSIQGPILLLSSFALYLFYIVAMKTSFWYSWSFLGVIAGTGIFSVYSFLGFGLLGEKLRQETLSLRLDYWRAGIRMIIDSPIFGKGPDAYGDWYRRERDLEAILKTSAGRVTNTAHNIFLDIGVSAGVVPSLVMLVLFVVPLFILIMRTLRKHVSKTEFIFFLLSVAYFLQSLISINQISVSVWGWLFLGITIGLVEKNREISASSNAASVKNVEVFEFVSTKSSQLPAGLLLKCMATALIGLVLVFFPLRTDLIFQSNYKKQSVDGLIKTSRLTGSNAVLMETALESMKNLAPQVQSVFAEEIVRKYPASVFAWKIIHDLNAPGTPLRLMAVDKFLELDPLNPETWTQKWMASPPGSVGRREAIEKLKLLDPNDLNTFQGWHNLESQLNCVSCQIYPGP